MPYDLSDEEIYKLARERVNEKKGFYTHLTVYIVVNILLVVIWAFTSRDHFPWFVFPLGGWGIGLLFHFLGVFVFSQHGTSQWEQKEMEKEIDKIKKSRNNL